MPSSQHAVLIVDADPKGLESLVYGFQGASWRMTACPTPETASLLVKASGAQVIVIASRSEHQATLALVRELRGKAEPCQLPILVLGPDEMRSSFKPEDGAEVLPLPTFVRDVLTASELLVSATTVQPPEGEPALQVTATSAKTLSLVRTMNGLGRSGRLRLERNGRTGEILFHQGELTAAAVGPLQGMAAVQHLMIWNDGKAELRLRSVPRRGQIHLGAHEFMQEMDRFQRDFAHAMKEIGPASAVYSANQDRLKQAGSAVPAEVTPVVRLCNGNRTLADVIDESPFRVLDTVRILGRLAELGVLTRSDGKPLVAHANDDFLNSARISASQQAWPMPAPITTPPAGTAVTPTPAPASPNGGTNAAASGPGRGTEATGAPAAEPRPRRQTLELGVPPAEATTPPPTAATPPPTAATPPPTAATPPPTAATPPPNAVAAPARVTPQPVIPTPPPAQPIPVRSTTPVPAPIAAALQPSGAFPISAPTRPAPPPAISTSPTPMLSMAPTPPPSRRPAEVTHAAGVIDSSKNLRRSQSMRATGEHPSVVIDAMATVPVTTPMSVPPDAASATSSGNLPVSVGPGRTTAPVVTGTLDAKPSGRTATQVIPTGHVSIELDSSLASPNPPANAPPAKPDGGIRITGEMHIPPSGRTTRVDRPAAKGSSFHIDPSLAADALGAGKTPRPVRLGHGESAGKTPRPVAAGSQAGAPKRSDSRPLPLSRSDSRPIDGAKRHQSGSFSSVEADFFAREADLYKEEKAESFADLDDKGAKGGKGKAKGGKPGRANRK